MGNSLRVVSAPTENTERTLTQYREPLRTWAGHGTGAICNGCGVSIQEHEIEYEIELPQGSTDPLLHFHFVCYKNWTGRGIR